MKKIAVLLAVMICSAYALQAQSIAYVNSETILEKIPEYLNAQEQIKRLNDQYEAQIEREIKSIETTFNQYQSEKARLSDTQRQLRENDIITKERAVKERQNQIFGQDGEMAKSSKEILSPVMEKLKNAIDAVAKEIGASMVLDLSVAQGVVFTDAKGDITQRVMAKMGVR
jgi:Outer membrane protein